MENLNNHNDEIDLIQIAKTIWKGKKGLLYYFQLFLVFLE